MNNIKFGIEIETTIPALSPVSVGRYHNGNNCPQLPTAVDGGMWKCERDGSIQYGPGRQPAEFVSPILSGFDGIQNVIKAVAALRDLDAKVNSSCGIHVTVEWNGNQAALARLIHLVANFESAFFASTGTLSREQGVFCKKIKQYGNAENVRQRTRGDRYHALNLTHIANGKNRVEFRVFSASLNILKIVGWIMMCLAAVEVALDGRIRPFENTTPETGVQCLKRFFATMNWVGLNNLNKSRGNLYPSLNHPEMPRRRAIRNELLKMAAKYDSAVSTR